MKKKRRAINYASRDFDSIKKDLVEYAKRYYPDTYKDFSEASFGSLMLDLVAYVGDQLSFYSDFQSNETFIDSATLRENVVSLARNIGYVPRSKRAARMLVDFSMVGINTNTTTITFQPGLYGNGSVSSIDYLFSIPQKVTATAKDGESAGSLEVFQGQYLESRFVVNDSLPNQRYILPNNGVDTSTIRVSVKENNSSTTSTEYKIVDNIIGITSTSNIYLIQETTDEKYEILFGDGIFGAKLQNGNVIDI